MNKSSEDGEKGLSRSLFAENLIGLFNLALQGIAKVEIVKMLGHAHHFLDVDLRIGNVDEVGSTAELFSQNPVAGTFGASTSQMTHVFVIQPLASGRFLTFQSYVARRLAIDEVYVTAWKPGS